MAKYFEIENPLKNSLIWTNTLPFFNIYHNCTKIISHSFLSVVVPLSLSLALSHTESAEFRVQPSLLVAISSGHFVDVLSIFEVGLYFELEEDF